MIETTHHIEFDSEDVSFNGESFFVHLTDSEATQLYLCLRERLLGLDANQSVHPFVRNEK